MNLNITNLNQKKGMPQTCGYPQIIILLFYFMTQIVIHKTLQKSDYSAVVESDAKNPLPTKMFDWTDLAGLSWIFKEDSLEDYV